MFYYIFMPIESKYRIIKERKRILLFKIFKISVSKETVKT